MIPQEADQTRIEYGFPVVSSSGVFAATDSLRLPFFEIEFLCDQCVLLFSHFFFNWRH